MNVAISSSLCVSSPSGDCGYSLFWMLQYKMNKVRSSVWLKCATAMQSSNLQLSSLYHSLTSLVFALCKVHFWNQWTILQQLFYSTSQGSAILYWSDLIHFCFASWLQSFTLLMFCFFINIDLLYKMKSKILDYSKIQTLHLLIIGTIHDRSDFLVIFAPKLWHLQFDHVSCTQSLSFYPTALPVSTCSAPLVIKLESTAKCYA